MHDGPPPKEHEMKRTKRFNLRRIALGLAIAALIPASAQAKPVSNQPLIGPGEIPYLSQGVGVDESQFAVTVSPDDRAFSRATTNEVQSAQSTLVVGPGEIPYLSQGVGVTAANFDPTVVSPDDRNVARATSVGASPTATDDGWSVDLSTGLLGIILALGAAGATLAIRHSRKTKLSPA
jgi:hypothetical protein